MGRVTDKNLARGVTLRTYESGKKVLRITFQYKGINCRETIKAKPNKTGEKYAVNLKAEIESKIERGTFNYPDYFPDSRRAAMFGHSVSDETVNELLDTWLDEVKHANRNSTYGAYNRAVNQIKPFLGKFKLRHLETKTIKRMIKYWGYERGVKLKTIRNYLLPLRAIIDDAIAEGSMSHNPLDQIKIARLVDRKKSNAKKAKPDPFNPEEIEAILNQIEELYGESCRSFFQFGFYQGIRISELFGLKWIDVDLKSNRVKIERAVVERVTQEETKTEAGEREIDLTVGGHSALLKQKKYTLLSSHGFVFERPNNKGPFFDYEHSGTMWKRALSKEKIRYRSQNQMRHSFASNKLSGNANIFYMAEQMGHETPEMLMRVYAKWIKAAKDGREMAQEFERIAESNTINSLHGQTSRH